VGLLQVSCAATSEALSDRLEGELHGLRRLRVARHLAGCGRCRETLVSLARLIRAPRQLRETEEPGNGSSVVDDVLARIRGGSAADGGD